MYPVLFRLGWFEVTSFGAMVAVGALLGLWLLRHELARRGLEVSRGTDAALGGVLGGLAGAKLLYTIEHLHEGLGMTLFSRGGMSWFGGLTGGLVVGLLLIRRWRLPIVPLLSAASPALALGQGVGRIGCFLVGDDYGRPTSLPWGVAFPHGLPPTSVPVHPTQLYEAAALFVIAWVLVRWRRRGTRDLALFGGYLVLAGVLRFLIEFIRVNVRVAFGLTTAQFFAAGAIVVGTLLIRAAHRRGSASVQGG